VHSPQGRNVTSPARQCWDWHINDGESASADDTKTRCNHVSEPECTAVCAEHRRLNPRTFSTTKQFTAEYAENAEKLKPFLRTLRSAVGCGQTQSERDSGWFPYVIHSPQGRNIISPHVSVGRGIITAGSPLQRTARKLDGTIVSENEIALRQVRNARRESTPQFRRAHLYRFPPAFSMPFHKEVPSSTGFAQRLRKFSLLPRTKCEKVPSLQA
jgi:hypothetical protein